MADEDKDKLWYFNTVKQEAEQGRISPVGDRMGPYQTREEAMNAWEIFNKRNEHWENQDREWNGNGSR
ncbi:MAG: hypothetical protein ABF780_03300 [Bifidobacterium aquikefiri]|uniref:SPOR domain-containing protein n=1 Tax=Bifidobacterium aquikefiri TaxID=1653207 RepID=A0A261G5U0_9BIFI|nr:hypothetical protein [Bifidobacterium aquikefiri]OZG66764.1 hypothetical protein BAQU_0836 [Bifidobacterium aquikefiri]